MKTKQLDFENSGAPLNECTFVVLDIETTGLKPGSNSITEIAAVKICSGQTIGTFHSLVNPEQTLSKKIISITGITNEDLADAPSIESILPSLLEFIGSEIIVGHNIGFDISFINAELSKLHYPVLNNLCLDTLSIARKVIPNEVRNFKLATLANYFDTSTVPTHRAYKDVEATIEVFHRLLERSSSLGVSGINDLISIPSPIKRQRYFKKHIAKDAPSTSGIYVFSNDKDQILYIGKSRNIKSRLYSYFTNDDRSQMTRLIKQSTKLDYLITPTAFEARIAELRLLTQLDTDFNVADKKVSFKYYVYLDNEQDVPCLKIKKASKLDFEVGFGPFGSRRVAEAFLDAVNENLGLRNCTKPCKPGITMTSSACISSMKGNHSCFCSGDFNEIEEYRINTYEKLSTLQSTYTDLSIEIIRRMRKASDDLKFEKAQKLHNQVLSIQKWMSRFSLVNEFKSVNFSEENNRPGFIGGRSIVRFRSAKESEVSNYLSTLLNKANKSIESNREDIDNVELFFVSPAEEFKERLYSAIFLERYNLQV